MINHCKHSANYHFLRRKYSVFFSQSALMHFVLISKLTAIIYRKSIISFGLRTGDTAVLIGVGNTFLNTGYKLR
jgi:hypothetical protein